MHITMGMSNNSVEYLFLNSELSFLISCLIRNILMIEIHNDNVRNNNTTQGVSMNNSTSFLPDQLYKKNEAAYILSLGLEWFGFILFVIAISIFIYQVSL